MAESVQVSQQLPRGGPNWDKTGMCLLRIQSLETNHGCISIDFGSNLPPVINTCFKCQYVAWGPFFPFMKRAPDT